MKNTKSEVKVFRISEERTKEQIAEEILDISEGMYDGSPSKYDLIEKLTDETCQKFMDEFVNTESYKHGDTREPIMEFIDETPSLSELFN